MSARTETAPDRLHLVSLAVLVMVAFGTLFYAYSVFVTEEAAGAEFSISLLSAAWTGALLVGGALAFLIGRHVDRRGVRGIMALGTVVGAAGLLALSASQAGWQVLLASWLLIGPAGAMTFYEPAYVAVDQWFGLTGSARSLALLTVIGGLAGPVFLPLTGALVVGVGWRATAAVLAALLLATGMIITGLLFPRHRPRDHLPHRAKEHARPAKLFADRRFALYTAAVLLILGSVQAMILHRIAVFEEAGFAVTTVAWWAALAGLVSLPGRWIAPNASTRIRPVLVATVVTAVMGASVVLAATAASTWQMGAHFIVFGITFGALTPMRAVVMSRWYSGAQYGRILGTQWTIVATIASVGPLLIGVLRDTTGSYAGPMLLVAAALGLAAALTLAAEPRPPAP